MTQIDPDKALYYRMNFSQSFVPFYAENNRRSAGIVLIEFLICIPLLLLFIAAVINFGAILSQTQHITSSLRAGARAAALQNRTVTSCTTLESTAENLAAADLEDRAPPPNGRWEIDTGQTQVLGSSAGNGIDPSIQVLRMVGKAKDEDNCIFCWSSFPSRVTPSVTVTMMLPEGCS